MIVDHDVKVVIATPTKCGKTSLEAMVKRSLNADVGRNLEVVRPGQHRLDLPPSADDSYTRLMMVRNPWSRLVSTWSFLANPKSKGEHRAKEIQQMSFSHFVHWWLKYRDDWCALRFLDDATPAQLWSAPERWLMNLTECAYVWNPDGLVHLENMERDLAGWELDYGTPVKNNSSDKVRPGVWTDYWNTDLYVAVGQTLRPDANLGGYSPNSVLKLMNDRYTNRPLSGLAKFMEEERKAMANG